jgi:hypothetical protein
LIAFYLTLTAAFAADQVNLRYDFETGSQGWLAGFADYPVTAGDWEFLAELRAVPTDGFTPRGAYYIQGNNHSDYLFMYIKRPVSGLEPNQAYRVSFTVDLASNAQSGCVGVGGSPGDGVYLKMGASTVEPVAALSGLDIRMNIDKGNQEPSGADAGTAGTIANGVPCGESDPVYLPIRRTYTHENVVFSDDHGSLWLILGTDSAFEGLTGLYYDTIAVTLDPADEEERIAAPIDGVDLLVRESLPVQYAMAVTSGVPDGCHESGGTSVRRDGRTIYIRVWNRRIAPDDAMCTMIYKTVKNVIELGTDFESGVEYTVYVNDRELKFTAQ